MAGLAREDIPAVTALIAQAAATCGVLLVEHNIKGGRKPRGEGHRSDRGIGAVRGIKYNEVARDPRMLEAYIGVPLNA